MRLWWRRTGNEAVVEGGLGMRLWWRARNEAVMEEAWE